MDNDASAQFFGYSQSATKCGHAVFALIFSIWSYKAKTVKIPMLASRFIAVVACCIYLIIEYVPHGKRYVFMSVYILLGIANSASTVLRGYIVMCSTTKDRAKAFAIIGLSLIASIVIGPMLQLIFSGIAYPGFEVLPGIRFHVFSVPIWVSLFLTVITAFIILFFMHDVHPIMTEEEKLRNGMMSLKEKIVLAYETVKNSNLKWKLIGVCLIVKVAVAFLQVMVGTVLAILGMVMYGWTGTETVQVGSTVMISFGLISISVLLLYIFCKLGEILPQEKVFLGCVLFCGLFFVITYPFDFNSQPAAKYKETTHVGCNSKEYSWCENAMVANPIFFLIATIVIFAPSLPMLHTSLDTVYSKVLGNIDQNVAQGVMTVMDDILGMVLPILATTLFTIFGIGPLWITTVVIFFSLCGLWVLNLKEISAV
uniref:Uncharacterized protein n=2 Tax=Caenorhabditis japonica TaxID=281687 RepID=A0A8R1I8U1_CAEJA